MREWTHKYLKGDPVIWFIVITLSLFSILVVYSATGSLAYRKMGGDTEYYLFKHTTLVFLSLFIMWLAHWLDYRYYAGVAKIAVVLSVPLLLITWQFGVNINEASRWISIPVINYAFQPSDLAKLALIVALARMLSKKQKDIKDVKKSLVPMLGWISVICLLIAMTNISSAMLLFVTCLLLMFIGRVPVKYLALLIGIGVIAIAIAFSTGQRGKTAISRLEDFFIKKEIPYQAQQSFVAIATGGVIGKGPGQSDQKNFLPHPYSDFIYAIIIEEYGLIGGIIILSMYLILLQRGVHAMAKSKHPYGGLLAAGLSFALVIQAIVNMAVAAGLGPITGLPLPLLSMGGTSQLFTGLALGIILSVTREYYQSDKRKNTINNQKLEAA